DGGYIFSSYASGNVEGSTYVGGLVGYNNGTVSDAYATGDVFANVDYAGGLVGSNNYATINNAYASGFVKTAGTVAGGLVSQDFGPNTVINSYWDTQTTGQAIDGSTGAIGLSTAQMMSQGSFTGFDFCACSGKWWISEGNTRPFLRSEYSTTITNGHQLQLMALDLSAKYTLANNIDMSELGRESGMWNKATGFVPIGDRYGSNPFVGGLDGAGYTINKLVIKRASTDYVGLFSYIGSGSNIRNVGLVGAQIAGQRYTGALVGLNDFGTISGSYSVKDEAGAGSVAGSVAVGGLVGYNRGGVDTSYSDVDVTGSSALGGLVGQNEGSISDAYASGSVAATGNIAGGLVGKNSGSISRTYATGRVTGAGALGGLVGKHEVGSGAITNSYWDNQSTGQAHSSGSADSSGKTTGEMKQLATFAGFEMDDEGGTGKVWRIYEGNTGPLLRNFLKGVTVADRSTTYNGDSQSGADLPAVDGRSGTSASGRNAGSYGAYSGQQGYDIKGGKLVIGQATLTLKAVNDVRTYDGTTQSDGEVVAVGLFGSDSVAATQSFSSKNAGSRSLTVDDGFSVSDGNNGGNYIVKKTAALGSIKRAALTVTADKVVKTYDGTTTSDAGAKVGTLAGAGAGETAAGAKVAFTLNSASVGNKTVKVSGLKISDTLGDDVTGNYLITYVGNSNSTINKRTLNVTGTG
ncbi:MAG: GLUG motif-containing protein, partial [Pseudomonadota bacterium]